tara:strand:- start:669 stop:827 length:159 start_codon:yes stop_codon:yes gene_type:complete
MKEIEKNKLHDISGGFLLTGVMYYLFKGKLIKPNYGKPQGVLYITPQSLALS